jgi:hypothetical protein
MSDANNTPNSKLRAFMETMKRDLGDDPELLRQAYADLNALERQNARNNFEARQEYARQVAEVDRASMRNLVEYGLQTLKWSFLLNAGAIAVIMAYVGGALGRASTATSVPAYAEVIWAIWPFVIGCALVVAAGASAYFNFCIGQVSLPSAEMLHNFLSLNETTWPIARAQKIGEPPTDLAKRRYWKLRVSRGIATVSGLGSTFLFLFGVYLVMHAALK